jgi:hypothetical protein
MLSFTLHKHANFIHNNTAQFSMLHAFMIYKRCNTSQISNTDISLPICRRFRELLVSASVIRQAPCVLPSPHDCAARRLWSTEPHLSEKNSTRFQSHAGNLSSWVGRNSHELSAANTRQNQALVPLHSDHQHSAGACGFPLHQHSWRCRNPLQLLVRLESRGLSWLHSGHYVAGEPACMVARSFLAPGSCTNASGIQALLRAHSWPARTHKTL